MKFLRCTFHAVLLLAIILVTSCQTYQPSTITHNTIVNHTIGWNGISIQIPERFTYIDPAEDASAQAYLEEITKKTKGPWADRVETHLFSNNNTFIIVSIVTYNAQFEFNKMAPDQVRAFLKSSMDRWIKKNQYDIQAPYLTSIEGHRGMTTGVRSTGFRKNIPGVSTGYFILGRLNEGFYITGQAPEKDLLRLDADLIEIIKSLRY